MKITEKELLRRVGELLTPEFNLTERMLNSSESELRALVNLLEHVENVTHEIIDSLEYSPAYRASYRLRTTCNQYGRYAKHIVKNIINPHSFEHWDFVDALAEIDTILNREGIDPHYIFTNDVYHSS